MDATAFVLMAAILSVAVGAGVLVWRLTPDRPRIQTPAPERTPEPPAGGPGGDVGWTAPGPPRQRGGAQPMPLDPVARPTRLVPVPSERREEFVAGTRPAADPSLRTRALGFLGMLTLVAASAAALAAGIYWAARSLFQAVERYFAE